MLDRRLLRGREALLCGKGEEWIVPNLRREIYQKLKGLESVECPFAKLPEKKRTQWALH